MITLHAPDGTRLALHELGGSGSPVLLVPGLGGHAREWSTTAAQLADAHRVFGLDPRGHGDSERHPADVSRAAHIADTATALEATGPAVLIGQSLGGHTAMLTAARHPDLVTRLVLVEAGPEKVGDDAAQVIDGWLSAWPLPFSDLAAAAAYFGGGAVGDAWAAGLRGQQDGWHPAFDRHVMVATIAAAGGPYWDDFARISCPTLVVRGGEGTMQAGEYARMKHHPGVTAVEIDGAGHDVHLDSPERWHALLAAFLT